MRVQRPAPEKPHFLPFSHPPRNLAIFTSTVPIMFYAVALLDFVIPTPDYVPVQLARLSWPSPGCQFCGGKSR